MMKHNLLGMVALAALFCLTGNLLAQNSVEPATRQAELRNLSASLHRRDQQQRPALEAYARRTGVQLRRELPNGRVLELQRLTPDGRPVFYITNNVDAADTVSTDEVWPGGSAGLDLDGYGLSIAQWDGGAVYSEHPDLAGRVMHMDGASEISGHSTHVAGTLIGAGSWLLPEARGMAFTAQLEAYDWLSDTAEMATAAANGQLLSNHSYGIAAGWIYTGEPNPPDTWLWIGGADPSVQEDPNFGYYDAESQLWDQIAYDAPYYLMVKAAGNDRSDFGAAPGEEYTVIDQNGQFVEYSTTPRPADCAPAGYDCLPTHSVAKNILTIGAVDDLLGGYSPVTGPSAVIMSDFSSWGPTDDGRIKPDLVGNGVFLYSTWPDYPYYALAAGTSMSAPNVSGSLLLLQQHYQNRHGSGQFLRAATLKALAIHTADEAGSYPGPDYAFGWGLLNTKTAAAVISEDGGNHQIIEGTLANGATNDHLISVGDGDATVTATLVWADPPGTPVAPTLDPPDLMLVNDLDLRIIRGGTTHYPWILDPSNPGAAATRGDNFRDNVEQVEVNAAGAGSYTVRVGHKGALAGGANQDYALIISLTTPLPAGTGLLIDEDFSGGMPADWSVQTDYGISWTIQDPVPGHNRLDNLTGGSGRFALVYNDFSTSRTSLRTHALDLSANNAAVLRFNSYYPYYDLLETLNVDVSIDGGSSWQNAWQWLGFNPFPTLYTLDLSGSIAGQSNVKLQFRWDSAGDPQGDTWQVDNVQLEVFGGEPPPGDPPGMASNPSPANGAAGQGVDPLLSWSAGTLADSHDVYFGTTGALTGADFAGNQTDDNFAPGPLEYDTTYFWRIDEVNADGTTAGTTWSFTTLAGSPAAIHLAGLEGIALPAVRGRWTASVSVSAAGQDGSPEADVTVDGNWSDGANGSGSCLTGADGSCTIDKTNLKGNVASVLFTVNNLTKTGFVYAPAEDTAPDSIMVGPGLGDRTPSAVDDSFVTAIDTPVSGNLIENDDPGDAPASIESHTDPASGVLGLNADGSFSYAPDSGYTGSVSFTYRLVDLDGDLSNTATVDISVNAAPPPPVRTVTATPTKVKGIQHVLLTWENFTGRQVDIRRDSVALTGSPTANNGDYDDDIGVKGGGQTYVYEICEAGTANCAGATATF